MDTSDSGQNVMEKKGAGHKNCRFTPLPRIIMLIFLCLLLVCVLAAYAVIKSFLPKKAALFYPEATIDHMVEKCGQAVFRLPQSWMEPVAGSKDVLALSFEHMLPIPDAYTAYSFYIQMEPGFTEEGQEYSFQDEGIQPLLVTTCGYPPEICCTTDLEGNIKVLNVTDRQMTIWLDGRGVIEQTNWEYHGEVKFNLSPLTPEN